MFNALTFDAVERAQVHAPSATPPSDADGGLPSGFLREFGLSQYRRPHVPRGAHLDLSTGQCASTVGEVKAMIATLTLEIELDVEKARRS